MFLLVTFFLIIFWNKWPWLGESVAIYAFACPIFFLVITYIFTFTVQKLSTRKDCLFSEVIHLIKVILIALVTNSISNNCSFLVLKGVQTSIMAYRNFTTVYFVFSNKKKQKKKNIMLDQWHESYRCCLQK